jgi:uridine phosphorylase
MGLRLTNQSHVQSRQPSGCLLFIPQNHDPNHFQLQSQSLFIIKENINPISRKNKVGMSKEKQHHIQCSPGEVARTVLLPGDPARAESIAAHFDEARRVASNREYVTFTGTSGGVPVSVTSTGIGGPSTAIAVEELVRCGADTFIRIGTGGALQPEIEPGSFVVSTGVIRDEGTSRAYLPIEFPAVADAEVVCALSRDATYQGRKILRGIIHSKDSYYGQKEPERMPLAAQLVQQYQSWTAGGALISEMESATLFIVAACLKVRAGSIILVASNKWMKRRLQEGAESRDAMSDMIEYSLASVRALAR